MELWDVYDKNRKKTGKTMMRGSAYAHAPGEYHMVVHICIFNTRGEMLIQQRQPFKRGWPNMWDVTVGGNALAGDTSATAAEREVLEEIGYELDLSNVRPHFTINSDAGFDDYYIVETDIEIGSLHLQYEEVQKVQWASREEILLMVEKGIFIPYHKSLIDLLFAMRGNRGAHAR